MELSLYIHIPFCVSKCRYCDFYSTDYSAKNAHDFITAIKKEFSLKKSFFNLKDITFKTIYIGGGTPSILSSSLWLELADTIKSNAKIDKNAEWTIECNPESFSTSKAESWLKSGINRLSLGIQSLNDTELKWIGRSHNSALAKQVLANNILKDFQSVSVDVMYGLPAQTSATLQNTLNQIADVNIVKHISAYELTINSKTPFGRHQKLLPLPNENTLEEQMNVVLEWTQKNDFSQYEISNFSKKNYECKHNQAYWKHLPWLGLGPSAHSYFHPKRTANISNVKEYIDTINKGVIKHSINETLSTEELILEIIFLRLRTLEGLNESDFKKLTRENFYAGNRKQIIDNLKNNGLLKYDGTNWKPTEKGLLFADGIAEKFV